MKLFKRIYDGEERNGGYLLYSYSVSNRSTSFGFAINTEGRIILRMLFNIMYKRPSIKGIVIDSLILFNRNLDR